MNARGPDGIFKENEMFIITRMWSVTGTFFLFGASFCFVYMLISKSNVKNVKKTNEQKLQFLVSLVQSIVFGACT